MGGGQAEVQLHKFITLALDGDEWYTLEMLLPGRTLVPIELEAAWAPEPVWTFWKTETSLAPART
jgi:hypothetical protein